MHNKGRETKAKDNNIKGKKNDRDSSSEDWFYWGNEGRNIGQCRSEPFVLVRIVNRIGINYS